LPTPGLKTLDYTWNGWDWWFTSAVCEKIFWMTVNGFCYVDIYLLYIWSFQMSSYISFNR
jgi:hypothetical protein